MRRVKQTQAKQEQISRASSAKRSKATLRGHSGYLTTHLVLHRSALLSSLMRLLKSPFTSGMAVVVMAIALALAGGFYILLSNTQQFVDTLHTSKQISVFLQKQVTDEQAKHIAQRLRENNNIKEVIVISKQQALAEFRQYSGFGRALNALGKNPLPAVLQVTPVNAITESYQLKQLLVQLQAEKFVDFAQIDMEWVSRLQAIMQIAHRAVYLISGLLAIAVIFITGNTIRLELQSRYDELVVEKLVGATNAYICLPFLYSGFWFGFISGLFAGCIINLILFVLESPLDKLSLLYQSQFQLQFVSFSEFLILLLGASGLGILGALAVASYQLRLVKPR